MEPRFLFDGAGVATAAKTAADGTPPLTTAEAQAAVAALAAAVPQAVEARPADPARNDGKKEVAFIDTSLADNQSLVDRLRAGVEIELIGGGEAGLTQMAQWALTHSGYDAIHLISHGGEGEIRVGTDVLTPETLAETTTQAQLTAIGAALTPDGDVLIYGCDAGRGADGQTLIQGIARDTGADVAASTDPTGAAALGGDWVLETSTGTIDASALDFPDYNNTLGLSFSTAVTYTTDSNPRAVVIADFNNDGKRDLAVATSPSGSDGAVAILLGNGDGTFQTKVDSTTGAKPYSIVAADFNNDGKMDVVTTVNDSGKISVLLGKGDGTFETKVDYTVGSIPRFVVAEDLNNDNKIDLVVANRSSDTISVLLGNGNGTFQTKVDYATGGAPVYLALGDVNSDQKTDVVTSNTNGGSISVLLGNGNGTFQTKVDYTVGSTPVGVAVGDINGDSKTDLVVANSASNTVSVLLGNGNGTFQAKTDYGTASYPWAIALADLNDDGKVDIAVSNYGSASVSVLRGNGDGTFKTKSDFSAGANPIAMTVGDVNGDDKPDIVTTNQSSSTASVLLNISSLAPSVTSINRPAEVLARTKADTVIFDVTFSAVVTGVSTSNFSLSGSGVTGTISSVSGSGTTWSVTVTGVSGDGTLGLDLSTVTGIVDASNGALAETHTSDETYTVDQTRPTVTAIERQTPNAGVTNADTLVFRVTFSEAVANVDASDFTVSGTTGTVSGVASAGGNAYDVTVSGGDLTTVNGTVTLAFDGSQNITDSIGNALTATTPTGTDHASYTLDNTAPTVSTIVRRTAAGGAAAVVYRVTFSEALAAAPAIGDFAVFGTTGTVTDVASAGGNAYDVTLSGGDLATVDGTITLAFANGQTIIDTAGNPLAPVYPTGVTVATISRASAPSTRGVGGLGFTVTFSQAVDGVTADAFTVLKGDGVTGTPTITITAGADGSSAYTVHVAGLAGNGAVELDLTGIGTGIVAHGTATLIPTATTSGQAYTLDNAGPTIASIERQTPSGAYTRADSVTYRVTFNEAVSNLDASNFAVTGTTGTVTTVTAAGGNAYDVTVSGGDMADLNGTITLGLAGDQNITDALGNALTVTTVSGTDHSTYTIDNTAPTLVSIVRRTAPGAAASVVFRVTFDGPMAATAATSDFVVTGTTGTVTTVTAAGDNAYDVTISGGDLANVSGTLTLGFARGQALTDAAGNPLNPTFPSSYWGLFGPGNFTSQFSYGASMTIDNQGTTYVAFNDGLNAGKATVMTFDGTSWMTVGNAGISTGSVDFISMTTDQNGTPYIAFRDNGNDGKATVMRFNGTSWEAVGNPGFTPGEIAYSSLVISTSGTPYLAFQNSNYLSAGDGKTTVMKFNGATWETVGNASFTAGSATHGSLFVDYYDKPYFAFSDGANGGKATVMTLSGTGGEAQWVAVGDAGFSAGAAQYLSLTFDGLNYFLAYQDSGNDGKATVMKFNGASWDAVGTPGFTAGAATYVSLAIDYQSPDRTLYVGFRDDANGGKATVMSYNGTRWETVGNAGFSATDATFVSFGVYGGIPYLAYAANDDNMRTGSVMRLTPGVTLSSIERASAEKTNGVAGLSYTVTFSGPVDGVTADDFTVIKGDGVTGTPTITISTGADGSSSYDVTVTGLSGEGPVALNFSGHGTGVVVHGGTAPVPDSGSAGAAYALDTVAPTVTEVTASTGNGTYKAGDTVSIQVTFSEAVTVTGSPRLTLNSATGGRVVSYTSGSGTTTLTFTYTVQAGDLSADLDFASTTALTLNGGSIKDGTGNNATLTLPTPGEAHSLGDNKNIVIDAVAPTASVTRADLSAPTGSDATFTVTYDGTGTGIDGTTIAVGNVTVTGPGSAVLTVTGASWDATTKTATYTFTPPGGTWDEGDAGTYTIGIVGNSVKDTAGNAVAAASSAKTFQVVYGPIVTDPKISISGATGNGGVFRIGDTVTATWDNSAAGDNNSRTISGAMFDFSQFGGGAAVTGTSDGQGHWTASYTIVSGSINNVTNRNVTVTATDSESLSTTTADGTNATVDNSAPAAPPAPVLDAASDSGTSNADAITNVTTPTITGTAEAGSTVRVYEGSTLLATTTADGEGGWSVATSALGVGSHTITATVTDAAGNTGSVSAGQTIVIDTAAPTTSVTRSDLIAPTGSSATVTVTYDGTGTEIDGTTIAAGNVTVTGPGSAVLTVTGASWDATTKTATYTFTPPGGTWDEGDVGTYTIGIVGGSVKDTAGNAVAAVSSAKTFQVVYSPIVTDPKISISGATGNGGVFKIGDTVTATWDNSAAGDNNSRTITGTMFDFSPFGGGPVAGTSDGQGHWTARYTIVSGSINNVANRNVTVTATSIDHLSATTADGTNATVDNSAPTAPPAPTLSAASDSGTSNADAITSVTTPTITGTAEANSTVRVFEGATLLATTTADSAGAWSITTPALGAGSHTITATATDAAGNTGTVSAGQTIVIDTAAPTASVTRSDLIAPTGDSATVTITYDGTGAGIDAASIGAGNVTVTGPGNTSLNVTLDGWDAVSRTATYRFTAPGGTWDKGDVGTYTIGIVGGSVKDTAGNAVAAASNAQTFHVIDGPIVTDPHISISGATGNGGVFRIGDTVTATWDNSAAGDNNSRTITGAMFDFSPFGGGPVAGTSDGQGHWTARYTIVSGSINNVGNRNVAVTATSIDRLSATTADGTNATVDNSAPAAPPAPALHGASDSGWSNADAITSATTPTITGTAEANSTVRVFEGATLLATTTADSAGVWSVATSALGAGSHTITVTATDAAGNTGTVSAGQTIIVETIAPVSITGTLVVPNGSGAGTDIGRISARDPGGQALRYRLIDDANGRFTIDQDTGVVRLKQALNHSYSAAGLYPITVQVTDAAGLASTATLAVRVTLSSPPPVTAPTPPPVNAPVPQPPPPLTTPTISVGTVGATDTGGGVGGRLITTDAMSSSGSDTGAGNGGDRLITASNMNDAAGQSMISTASGSQSGTAVGQSGGSSFSAGLPGGGFGSGFGPGGGSFGSSLSSGVFGSSLIGGTTETGPARTLPPATGERQGQGPQDGRDTAGEPSPPPAAPDTNTPDSPAPDSARTGEAPQPSPQPQPPRPQAALPGPAARSFTDQLAEAAGRFEHERATLIAAARSAAGLIGRDAA